MKLLMVTPHKAPHMDAGLFWHKEIVAMGHDIHLWDYRAAPLAYPRRDNFDGCLVFKGETVDPKVLPRPAICYWPDDLGRTPGIESQLEQYDMVFTPVRPTPEGMFWLPTGWDESIHRNRGKTRWIETMYIGTANSEYKRQMVTGINPEGLAGNGWKDYPPLYGEEFVDYLNQATILINLHQNPEVGLNRKFFEMIACGFTLTDRVPGVEEILGKGLADQVSFTGVDEAKQLIKEWIYEHPMKRNDTWHDMLTKISKYTYKRASEEVLTCLESLR